MEKDSIAITNGRILDPAQGLDIEGNLLIENGRIKAITPLSQAVIANDYAQTIDAKGCYVLPGLIDPHVHLREPGQEYKETIETGTRAAIQGGFTTVACMANTNPVNDNPYVTAYIREKAKSTGHCEVIPVGAVSKGLKGIELAEIGGMIAEGARAISDDGIPVMNSYLMRKALDYSKAFDVPVITHAEDHHLVGQGVMTEGALSNELGLRGIPRAAEEILVARDIALVRLTGARLHIAHVSTREAIEHIRRAKEDGLPVTAEVTPHHLFLTADLIRTYDTRFKMAPPLREQEDAEALRQALSNGVLDMIASDHAPHGLVDKAVEFDRAACGVVGLETSAAVTFRLVQDQTLGLMRWVESLTLAPARLLKLDAGTLKTGAAADVCVFNPKSLWNLDTEHLASKSRNSPFLGRSLQGRVRATIVRGRVSWILET